MKTEDLETTGYDMAIALRATPRDVLDVTTGQCVERVLHLLLADGPSSAAIAMHSLLRTLADWTIQLRGRPLTEQEARRLQEQAALGILDRSLRLQADPADDNAGTYENHNVAEGTTYGDFEDKE